MIDGAARMVRVRPWRRPSRITGVNLAVYAAVIVLNILQQPGRITFDTKLDLQLNPTDLLARSGDLWNGDWALGGLQNQASGYLFPMGPAFIVGELLGVPMWVWQRLWSAAVMILAYEGARRLAARWPGIGTTGAVLAGLTYMLSPRVLTTAGGLSGETLPAAVLPWTVLPLVLFLCGRLRGWVAFVLSAATVPLMGGQNATLVVACLVLPALLLALASGRSLRQRFAHLAGWGALVGVASLWWVVPLLLLGSYAPPFLDFIESARNTAGDTGWLSSLRGTSHWVAFFPGGGQIGWEGGYELASSRLLLLPTILVAAVGLAGLMQKGLWERRVLVGSLLVGLAVLTAGSGGWAGSVFADAWLHALDTSLAPLRNIHKFDPVVRLPLSLGVAAFATSALPRAWRWTSTSPSVPARSIAVGVVGVLVLAAAGPAAAGSLRTKGGFDDVPVQWRDAVAFLDDQPGPTRTIVLPGAGFAVQTWGRTIDEPIQVLDPAPWMARAQVTIAPAGTLRLLDSVEQAVAEPRPEPSLEEALRAMGTTHVLMRNDLDPDEADAPDPEIVRASLASIPDARVVASYGRMADGTPAIEVYALNAHHEPRVALQSWDDRAVVTGGPEDVPALRSSGLVGEDQAVVLGDEDEPDVLTDGLRRVERNFGRVHEATSAIMATEDSYRVDRPVHDYIEPSLPAGRTVAVYDGASDITASSSGAYADVLGAVRPEEHPYAAFDQSVFTSWASAPFSRPIGQWIEVRFDKPTRVGRVSLVFDNSDGVDVTAVRLRTDDRSVAAQVGSDGTVADVVVDDPATTSLRLTVLAATADTGRVRLADLRIAEHEIRRSLALPGRAGADTSVFMAAEPFRRACVVGPDGTSCDRTRFRDAVETAGFTRTVKVGERVRWRLGGSAVATYGDALDRLFAPLDPREITASASSTYGGDPAVNAAGAVDGRLDTGWTSAPGDPAPSLALSWGPKRRVSRIDLDAGSGQPARLPDVVVVDGGPGTGKPQLVATSGRNAGKLRPVRTNRVVLSVPGEIPAQGVSIAEVRLKRTGDLRHEPGPGSPTGTVCGFGPTVQVGGRTVRTRLSGTLDDLRSGARLDVIGCGSAALDLEPGAHDVRVVNPPGFAVAELTLTSLGSSLPSPSGSTQPVVRSWGTAERRVSVDAAETSVLTVHESYNRGWQARVGDTELDPVLVEGWQQGFVVPAGTSGDVRLTYEAQGVFQAALIGGLGLVGALLALAALLLVGLRRRDERVVVHASAAPPGSRVSRSPRSPRRLVLAALLAALVLVLAVVSVPLAMGVALGAATTWLPRRGKRSATWAVLVAAVLAAAWTFSTSSAISPPEGADALVALAVGLACGHVLLVRERRGRPEPGVG